MQLPYLSIRYLSLYILTSLVKLCESSLHLLKPQAALFPIFIAKFLLTASFCKGLVTGHACEIGTYCLKKFEEKFSFCGRPLSTSSCIGPRHPGLFGGPLLLDFNCDHLYDVVEGRGFKLEERYLCTSFRTVYCHVFRVLLFLRRYSLHFYFIFLLKITRANKIVGGNSHFYRVTTDFACITDLNQIVFLLSSQFRIREHSCDCEVLSVSPDELIFFNKDYTCLIVLIHLPWQNSFQSRGPCSNAFILFKCIIAFSHLSNN